MNNVPTQTDGVSGVLAADWNTYVRDNFDAIKFGHIVCTSGTRPSSVAEGTMIYETDTNKVLVNSSATSTPSWVEVNDLDNAGGIADAMRFGHVVCTSSTRPTTNLSEGFMIYETDTDKALIYNGSAWVEINDITNGASNVIQRNVQQDTKYDTFETTSGSFTDITGLSVSITPSSTASKVLLIGHINMGLTLPSSANHIGYIRFSGGNSTAFVGDAAGGRTRTASWLRTSGNFIPADSTIPITISYLDSPATTSAVTYTIQVAQITVVGGASSVRINYAKNDSDSNQFGRAASSIIAVEVPQ